MIKKSIGIGLLGLGVVGSGVAEALLSKAESLAEQVGTSLVLRKALVRDVDKKRTVKLKPRLLTRNPEEVFANPEVDIVIEVIGAEHPAFEYITQAITHNKNVVTANKEVIAKHGAGLFSLAKEHNVDLRYEASVGSGIPLIAPFQRDLAANDISAIYGILNGTTNYILTRMSQEDQDFSTALKQAQKLGYAEPDPTNDIEGIDAAYKLAILSSLAFHTTVNPQDIYCEGISRIQAQDFRYAKELGYTIKLLAIAKKADETIEARVHPVFIPEDTQLAKVDGVYNAILVEGDLVGNLMLYGQGAGASRASSAIMADVLVIAKNIYHGVSNIPELRSVPELSIKPMSDIKTRYYFRLDVVDRPGVLAQISKVLGDNSISISTVIQKETYKATQTAIIVIMTHPAEGRAVQQAIEEINQLGVVNEVSNFIRVEG